MNITLQQINTLKAVVEQKSIQAGAELLNRTHPSVITAIKNLERQIGFALFDRSGYRSTLSEKGAVFYQNSLKTLKEIDKLAELAQHLNQNKEPKISIAIGEITPKEKALSVIRSFAQNNQHTTLNLLFENLSGVNEKLLIEDADIILHYINKTDARYEYKDFCQVRLVPVVAPGFLDSILTKHLKLSQLSNKVQCIIKSSALTDQKESYNINKNAQHIYVGDQHTKKEVIMQSMAWGHMPFFMIKEELEQGLLVSLEGEHIKSYLVDIVVARLRKEFYGPMAQALWDLFE